MVIDERLATLRLHGMHRTWLALVETRQHLDLSLSDGIELLLQAEDDDREVRRSERLLKQAEFRYTASLSQITKGAQRGIDKSLLTELATAEYIHNGTSVLITGATGCGKSYLACALGQAACDHGYRVLYLNMQKLNLRAKIAHAEGQSVKFFDMIRRKHLLIIDDFGLVPLDTQQRMDLMEVIEDRHGRAATIIASQLPVAKWFDVIGENTIADAILDRLVHTSHRIELKGESMRKKM
jgi:DNA replication protein DnaC